MSQFIAIYGKGGIGKSTITSHIAVSFRKKGFRVLQIGCDPKHDSTFSLTGKIIPTLAETLLKYNFHSEDISIQEIIHPGYKGINVIELGGPPAGIGCGGYIIGEGIELLSKLKAWEKFDIVLFDVLGDVVCGGFSVPLQYSHQVNIIATDDFDSLYAANRIAMAVKEKSKMYPLHLSGIIGNKCSCFSRLEKFCKDINTPLISVINDSEEIRKAKLSGKTIFELKETENIDIASVLFESFDKITEYLQKEQKNGKKDIYPLSDKEMFSRYMNDQNY